MSGSGASFDLEIALGDVGWVRGLARSLVRDPHAAEDLAQETWLAALQSKSGIRPRAWLGGIARILARRRLRRPEPRPAGLMEEFDEHSTSPDELLAQADFQRRVLAAVTALDEPYRTTVLLRYFEGLSVEELSRRMDVPGSTGRTRLQRAHAQLRERLDREYHERSAWGALAGAVNSSSSTLAEVGILGTQMKLVIGCGLAVVVGWAAWRGLEATPERRAPVSETDVVQVGASTGVEAPREADVIPAEEPAPREPVADTLTTPATNEAPPEESVDASEAIEQLRTALERSVNERIDPNAILDAALFLVRLEASDKAIPEPDPSGRLSFPILGLQEGIEAELAVSGPSRNPQFAHVLGLEMRLPKSDGAYLVDGMPRIGARACVTIWGDPEDKLLHFSILTDLDVDGREARKRGLLDDLTFVRGVSYHLDLGDPSKSGMRVSAMKNGKMDDREVPLLVDGGQPPREAIERFGKRLLEMYAGIRASGR